MDFAPDITAKPSIFTRTYFSAGLLAFSMLPLFITVAIIGKGASREAIDFQGLILAIIALQAILWFAQHRCGTAERSYWRSLLVIASCLSTGWSYFDVVFVPTGVFLAIVGSCVLACSRAAPQRMSRLVYWFYHHRMQQ